MKDKKRERKIIELEPNKPYVFQAIHPNYGRAEFIICPVYKYGKLKEIFMYPVQQDVDYYYHYNLPYTPLDFGIKAWTHKGVDNPWIWLHFWCKEHKCQSMRLYVPAQAKSFSIIDLSNLSIMFDNE